jgi:hypothetical protein
MRRPTWTDVGAWLAPLLVALAILAVAWLLWPALRQEQRPALPSAAMSLQSYRGERTMLTHETPQAMDRHRGFICFATPA